MPTGHPQVVKAASIRGLHPALQERYRALRAQMAALGYPIWLTSTYRDSRKQAYLYQRWIHGKSEYPAAPPGRSLHEQGRAFDIGSSREGLRIAGALAPYFDLRWGGLFSTPDPVHFER